MERHEETEEDFLLSAYRFALPEDRIAQTPSAVRSDSRLMILRRERDAPCEEARFADLPRYLPKDCLLVANNSRVIPARVFATRPGGGKLEFLLLTPLPLITPSCAPSPFPRPLEAGSAWRGATAQALLRPAKKLRVGETLALAPDLAVQVLEREDFGRCRVRLYWQGELREVLERRGSLPLPPYIRRSSPESPDGYDGYPAAGQDDAARYQTVYSRDDKAGSVAAPTAGLHFTPELREALKRSGREWAEVTLYVGYGTFSPVRADDIREHAMHAEYAELPRATLDAILRAKAQGRPVVAVGTTSARVLEGAFEERPQLFSPAREDETPPAAAFAGWTRIFLYPGKGPRIIDGLITNFHLPESSLLMLVSAFAGRERVLAAYRQAIERGFRFFSYGDAMLLL